MRHQKRHPYLILFVCSLCSLMVSMDYSIVNLAASSIAHSLNISINNLQWLITTFGVAFGSFVAVGGRFADVWGRKKVFIVSITLFGLASIGAGVATQPLFLYAMRFLQGISACSIFPCAGVLITENFADKNRTRALSIYGSIIGIGLAIGPAVGGFIVVHYSWRWIFFINVPIVCLSIIMLALLVKESVINHNIKLDLIAAFLFLISMCGFMLIINEGVQWGWMSIPMLSSLVITIICLCLFVFLEKKSSDPILPFAVINYPSFYIALLFNLITASVIFYVIFSTPIYLHYICGYSIAQTSAIVSILTVMTVVSPYLVGYLYHKKEGLTLHAVMVMSLVGLMLLAEIKPTSSLAIISLAFILIGMGWGAANSLYMTLVLKGVPSQENVGLISGALLTGRNIMAAMFLSIFTTLLYLKQLQLLKAHAYNLSQNTYHHMAASLPNIHKATQYLKDHQALAKWLPIYSIQAHAFVGWILVLSCIILWFIIIMIQLRAEK